MSSSMIVFPREEYEARWQKVDDEMKRRGYEVALIWGKGACTWDRMGDLLWLVNHLQRTGAVAGQQSMAMPGIQRRDHAAGAST